MLETGNFRILIPEDTSKLRTWGPDELSIIPGQPMARTNEDVDIFADIEKIWTAKFKEALQKGKSLFAGPQVRLSGYQVWAHGSMGLALAPTDYREFMGTNVQAGIDPNWMDKLLKRGKERFKDELAFFSQVLAICAVIETSDDLIIIGLRSDIVAEYPRCWHTVGGHPNPMNYVATKIKLFDAMRREICEELFVDDDEIESIRVMGLVQNRRTLKPELVFRVKVASQFSDIKQRRISHNKEEHLMFFGISRKDLVNFLIANQGQFSFPPAHGLNINEMVNLAPVEKPENTTNFFVPPGEAAYVLYLLHQDVDLKPYLQAVNVPA